MDRQKLLEQIDLRQEELYDLLCELIRINSENFGSHGNETECAQYIEGLCKELGLETDLDIAVKSDNLTGGMTVVCSPEQYLQYIGQKIAIGTATRQGLLGGK